LTLRREIDIDRVERGATGLTLDGTFLVSSIAAGVRWTPLTPIE
jgi:hypothetical protein